MTAGDLYASVAYELSRRLTLRYSSSFGLASRLFARSIRAHIHAVYSLVRVADEIVDTYAGPESAALLASLQSEVHTCIASGYSTNPIVHAFGLTARAFAIGADLIDPFFESMRADLTAKTFTQQEYETYIYGSAEVVGLMCLKVFCAGRREQYDALAPGARLLGSAYQKVNFLRDFADDESERGRIYFPGVTRASWNDAQKDMVVTDIRREFDDARTSLRQLPTSSRTAVYVSYMYYRALLKRLDRMSAEQIASRRAYVPTLQKLAYLLIAPIGARLL